MKTITLKADREIDRQIAKMCVVCELTYDSKNDSTLIGISELNYFAIDWFEGEEQAIIETEEITLDLSQVELDLRMAIGTDIEFDTKHNKGVKIEQITKYDNSVCFGLWKDGKKIGEFENHRIQLSTNWLKSVGVEVEE